MVLQQATIYFNDSASKYNKDLTMFLNRNIEVAIRRGHLQFAFQIVTPNQIAKLREKGFKKFPTMVLSDRQFVGPEMIIQEIQRRVKMSKSEAPAKTDDEILDDYMKKTLGPITQDDEKRIVIHDKEDTNDIGSQLASAAAAEAARRGIANSNRNVPAYNDIKPNPPPAGPGRNLMRDDLDQPEQRPNRPGNMGAPSRPDNVANPEVRDAYSSLSRIGRDASGEDQRDDLLMRTLLNKMPGGSTM